ncbi:hypothetical protein G7054_g2291 [Neopestalotiopsis clavispora]|nr:hypothetical protein G7054_g2291 [Neopestalotiopsis clavispora]
MAFVYPQDEDEQDEQDPVLQLIGQNGRQADEEGDAQHVSEDMYPSSSQEGYNPFPSFSANSLPVPCKTIFDPSHWRNVSINSMRRTDLSRNYQSFADDNGNDKDSSSPWQNTLVYGAPGDAIRNARLRFPSSHWKPWIANQTHSQSSPKAEQTIHEIMRPVPLSHRPADGATKDSSILIEDESSIDLAEGSPDSPASSCTLNMEPVSPSRPKLPADPCVKLPIYHDPQIEEIPAKKVRDPSYRLRHAVQSLRDRVERLDAHMRRERESIQDTKAMRELLLILRGIRFGLCELDCSLWKEEQRGAW